MNSRASGTGVNHPGALTALLQRGGVAPAVLVAWLVAAYTGVAPHLLHDQPPQLSTDDAMRLVQVRDLLAGQSWFDLRQYRLGLEGGIEMHWSRLIDAPLALLLLALTPLIGMAQAETAVTYAWPLIVLLPALATTAIAARAVAGPGAAWVTTLLMGLHLGYTGRYEPGELDHHNVQLTLLVMALCTAVLAPRSRLAAAGLGAIFATSVAIGVEHLPAHAAIVFFLALRWAATGAEMRRPLQGFAVSLPATLWLLLVLTAPASAYRGGYCDALSIDLAIPATVGAVGLLIAATLVSDRGVSLRIAVLALAGLAALDIAAFWVPACLANPLGGIDATLRESWLDNVSEARKAWAVLSDRPGALGPSFVAFALGIASAGVLAARRVDPWTWILFAGVLLTGLPFALMQIRGAISLGPLAVFPAAILLCRLFAEGRHGRNGARALAAMALAALMVPTATSTAIRLAIPGAGTEPDSGQTVRSRALVELSRCFAAGNLAALAALPPGLVSASSNLGPKILLETPHRVLTGPYHRNTAGMGEQLRIARATDAEAEERLRRLGVDYVVACTTDPTYATEAGMNPPGFAFRLNRGEVVDFLEPVPPLAGSQPNEGQESSPIRVYRLTAAR
jgi:hypothetical protein